MESLKQVLMRRDGLSAAEAQEMVDEAKAEVRCHFSDDQEGRDPETILYEDFGLEPDWVFELLD